MKSSWSNILILGSIYHGKGLGTLWKGTMSRSTYEARRNEINPFTTKVASVRFF